MSIRYWVAGPSAAVGLIATALIAWLVWGPQGAMSRLAVSADRAEAVGRHAEALLEAQHVASGLALDALDRGRTTLDDPGRKRVEDALAVAHLHLVAIQALWLDGEPAPSVIRLAGETERWGDEIVRSLQSARDPGQALSFGRKIAAHGRAAVPLARDVIDAAERSVDGAHAGLARVGAVALGLVTLAAVTAGGVAFGFGRSLCRAMQSLPKDLRALSSSGGAETAVAGETRRDEFAVMAQELRVFAETAGELRRSRAEMEKIAITDPLTGLPNRRGLFAYLDSAVAGDSDWSDSAIGVMHVDLDHFKTVNDTAGHEAGDFVLREATRRMAAVVRDSDMLARLGGDEFVILVRGVATMEALERVAGRLVRQFDAPIVFRDTCFDISVSVGALLGGRRGKMLDPKRLLINADIALCHAKAAGRDRYAIFTSSMAQNVRSEHEQAAAIREAIANGDFHAWLQPIVDGRTGRATGVEIIPRWEHPDRGVLGPEVFLDVAEAHNLAEAVGLQVLGQACTTVASCRNAGLPVPKLHVSLTRAQLLAPAAVDKISWILDDNAIEPEHVAIEFSERRCGGRGIEVIFGNLRRLSRLGATLVIRDFGAETAALANVRRLGASQIKLASGRAAALCRGAEETAGARWSPELLATAVRIGDSLGVDVLAAGVESAAEAARLSAAGLTGVQGEGVVPPMRLELLHGWLAEDAKTAPRAAG